MQARIEYAKVAPMAMAAMYTLEQYVRQSGLNPSLLELVKLRASQINGCAYCVDMHTKDARARGETEQRLYAVAVWQETPFFTEEERAALAWTEAVTRVRRRHVPEGVYELVRRYFSEKELVDLTMAIWLSIVKASSTFKEARYVFCRGRRRSPLNRGTLCATSACGGNSRQRRRHG